MIRSPRTARRGWLIAATGIAVLGALAPVAVASGDQSPPSPAWGGGQSPDQPVRAALPPGKINHILVIDMENEGFSSTWGPGSPATYLNGTLRQQGELIDNYYGIGHDSLDNYIAQVSGQAPTDMTKSDCSGASGTVYVNVSPGTDDPFQATNPGQVDGNRLVPVRERDLGERRGRTGNAGVVDENVDHVARAGGERHQLLEVLGIRHVADAVIG